MVTATVLIGIIVWIAVVWVVGAFLMVMMRGQIWRAQAVKATGAPERSYTVQLTVGMMALMWPYRIAIALRRAQRAAVAKRDSNSKP